MARVGTSNLNLGQWLDEENPGAGQQGTDNLGLNGNWLKIDAAVGTEHNANGTHKPNIILGSYLKQSGTGSTVDNVTLEFAANALQIKALGVGTSQLAATSVSTAKIQDDAVTAAKVNVDVAGAGLTQDGAGALQVNADGATLEVATDTLRIKDLGVVTAKINDDAVTAAKQPHDNNARKITVQFSGPSGGGGSWYLYMGYQQCSATVGWIAPRAGAITKISVVDSAGGKKNKTAAYTPSGATHFAADDILSGYSHISGDWTGIAKNGTAVLQLDTDPAAVLGFMVMEVEFDD